MGRVRTLRLPKDLESDVDKYLEVNGIRFTDLAVAGIRSQVYAAVERDDTQAVPKIRLLKKLE